MEQLIGRDVAFTGNVEESFIGYNSKIAQIVTGPWMSKGNYKDMIPLDQPEKLPLSHLIIHSSMMINLGNKKKWSVSILQRTLNEAAKILKAKPGLKIGVVSHIGKGPDADIESITEQVKKLVIPEGVTLYLENAAGQGNEKGSNLEELMDLFAELPPKIKLCLDTQHAFAAGLFAWKGKREIKNFFETIEIFLPDRLALIHLNDSKVNFGSRIDRHENLREGYIWKNNDDDLKYLLDYLIKKKLPIILETPEPQKDLDYIKSSSDSSPAINEGCEE